MSSSCSGHGAELGAGDLLTGIGSQKGVTPAKIALAWLAVQNPRIVPIPGTTELRRLGENLGAAVVELTTDDLPATERAASEIHLEGGHYPAELEAATGR